MLREVGFTNFTIVEDDIWFCDVYHNNLLRMQLTTGKICLETVLSPQNVDGKMQYGPLVFVKGKIVMAPRNANNILVYNIFTKELSCINLKRKNVRKPLFINGFVHDGKVFFVPGNYSAVIKVDVENMSVEYFEDFYYDLPMSIRKRNGILCNSNALIIDDFFIFPIFDSDILIKIYLDFHGYEIEKLGSDSYKIMSIVYLNGNMWFAGLEGIFEYLWEEKRIVCHNCAFTQKQLSNGIGQIMEYNKNIVAIPINGERIILFNPQKNECTEFQNYIMPLLAGNNRKYALTGSNIICCGKLSEEELCIFSTYKNEICLINLNKNIVRHYKGELDGQSMETLKGIYMSQNQIIKESDISVQDYIKYIIKQELQ